MIAITVRILRATDTKDTRIVAEANGHKLTRSVAAITREIGSGYGAHAYLACELARQLGWNPETLIQGEVPNGSVFVFASAPKWDVATGTAVS